MREERAEKEKGKDRKEKKGTEEEERKRMEK